MTFDPQSILGPQGPIARRLGARYEQRPQQAAMIAAVEEALCQGKTLLVEAGTGVGKSFAYLLPAVQYVLASGPRRPVEEDGGSGTAPAARPAGDAPPAKRRRRVVISTHTIALQEQLLLKDIPLLQAVIPEEFSAVLAKGRGNYVSLRRLKQASERQDQLFADEQMVQALHAVQDWAMETEDGSLATLPVLPGRAQPAVWEKVQSDSGNCMGRRCPTYQKCFYQQARRRMHNADLLIVNHALFFADLALRAEGAAILPAYDAVILDEAHTVEDVASEHFGASLSESQVRFLANSLLHPRTGRGFLATLTSRIERGLRDRAARAVAEVEEASAAFFDSVSLWQDEQGRSNGRIAGPDIVENPLSPALEQLSLVLKMLKDAARDERDRFELGGYAARAEALAATLQSLLGQKLPDSVYWAEIGRTGRGRRVRLTCAPIEVGPLLHARLFGALNPDQAPLAVVLTSATLTTAGTPRGSDAADDVFAYSKSRLGVDAARTRTLQLGSPFDYARQAELILEGDLPEPNAADFFDRLCPRLLHHLERSDGGAFVLFTSYDLMQRAARWLGPQLERRGMPLLVHGDGEQRTALLARFRGDRRSVLLGVDSFWQGVDVPGDALRNVIIPKLPFAVPDRPLTEARMQRIEARGGNAFAEYSLPQALLKFKQGFGRLIRSRTDTGSVVVLDRRIVAKRYGRQFIEALPPVRVRFVGRRPGRQRGHDAEAPM